MLVRGGILERQVGGEAEAQQILQAFPPGSHQVLEYVIRGRCPAQFLRSDETASFMKKFHQLHRPGTGAVQRAFLIPGHGIVEGVPGGDSDVHGIGGEGVISRRGMAPVGFRGPQHING